MTVCKHVFYWGKVQGVGFRYTTLEVARHHTVTGYVKNTLDGQVELVVEGAKEEVDRFLTAVAGKMTGYIKGQTVRDETPQGFEEFQIRS
ncbi:MAG TPA: acylphosphatase [Gemmataceae bacterium]|jgi:acylphosphatase|nr:acylphosphatase [Gemmataceae bacterium]